MTTPIRDYLAKYSNLVPRESILRDRLVEAVLVICELDIPPDSVLVQGERIILRLLPSSVVLHIREHNRSLCEYVNTNPYGFIITSIH